jgi:hypothetical protein
MKESLKMITWMAKTSMNFISIEKFANKVKEYIESKGMMILMLMQP